jgi:hypothetical protein
MKNAPIIRGSTSSAFLLTKALLFATGSAFSFWSAVSRGNYMAAFVGTMFLGLSIMNLILWISFRKGHWKIEWDGSHVVIKNGNHIDYDGSVSGMHQVDQDGRGYFLYPTKNIVYRLRRGQSSDDLDAVLDKAQEARTSRAT